MLHCVTLLIEIIHLSIGFIRDVIQGGRVHWTINYTSPQISHSLAIKKILVSFYLVVETRNIRCANFSINNLNLQKVVIIKQKLIYI